MKFGTGLIFAVAFLPMLTQGANLFGMVWVIVFTILALFWEFGDNL
jgi:hypothetical protein